MREKICDGHHAIHMLNLRNSLKTIYLNKVASERKYLTEEEQAILHNILIK